MAIFSDQSGLPKYNPNLNKLNPGTNQTDSFTKRHVHPSFVRVKTNMDG